MTRSERNAAIIRKIEAYTKEHTRTKEAARAALIREGFLLKDGSPAPEFAPSGREHAAKAK